MLQRDPATGLLTQAPGDAGCVDDAQIDGCAHGHGLGRRRPPDRCRPRRPLGLLPEHGRATPSSSSIVTRHRRAAADVRRLPRPDLDERRLHDRSDARCRRAPRREPRQPQRVRLRQQPRASATRAAAARWACRPASPTTTPGAARAATWSTSATAAISPDGQTIVASNESNALGRRDRRARRQPATSQPDRERRRLHHPGRRRVDSRRERARQLHRDAGDDGPRRRPRSPMTATLVVGSFWSSAVTSFKRDFYPGVPGRGGLGSAQHRLHGAARLQRSQRRPAEPRDRRAARVRLARRGRSGRRTRLLQPVQQFPRR